MEEARRQGQGWGWLSGAAGAQRRDPVTLEEMALERVSRKSDTGQGLKVNWFLLGEEGKA